MRRADRRSDCPINFTVERLGDSWSLLVLRDLMFKGKRTYSQFAESDERISTNILADRLKSLCAAGLVWRDGRGRSTRYSLTESGIDLLPMMVEMIVWGATNDPGTAAPASFVDRAVNERDAMLAEIREALLRDHCRSDGDAS